MPLFESKPALMLIALLTSLPHSLAGIIYYSPIRRSCAAPPPTADLVSTHLYLQENETLNNDLWNSSSLISRHASFSTLDRRQATAPLYTIDTYMHIVSDSSSASPTSSNYITDTMIENQLIYLAHAYTNASIGFRLAGVDRITNDTWASNGDDLGMKTALRKGSYSSLNIYFQSQLQAGANRPGVAAGSTLLGFCSPPASGVISSTPAYYYVTDGCNVLSGTMPGGNVNSYNLGGTAAHEVGHWNGLLHTFNGNSCSQSDWGDYVADTPQEMTSTSEFSFSNFFFSFLANEGGVLGR